LCDSLHGKGNVSAVAEAKVTVVERHCERLARWIQGARGGWSVSTDDEFAEH
jgi:hypothetical protein